MAQANTNLFRLMGQDSIHLQVIATSSEGKEQRNAQRVLDLMQKGKHWVLVTLLLSNVIVNETLPIILDRSLGGGWPAVLGSTGLIGTCVSFVQHGCANKLQLSSERSFLNLFARDMDSQLAPSWHPTLPFSCGL